MALNPLQGFQALRTHHCVTGSLRHIYVYNRHPLSEELLLGIGAGVGFGYWHTKGAIPFLGGRANTRGEFEPLVGARTGVRIQSFTSGSARKAEEALLGMLAAGQPVMLQCDMGFLPYFDFQGRDYHFGGHAVVACGYDAGTRQVLIADRDGVLHPVVREILEWARGSSHKPFPPERRWYAFDFSDKRQPTATEVRQAIIEQAAGMLEPPISNLGAAGILKAAKKLPGWPDLMVEPDLRRALFQAYTMVDAVGGTGGGLFRYMLSRFLREAAAITADPRLSESAGAFEQIGDGWQQVAALLREASCAPEPARMLSRTTAPLMELADREEAAWTRLRALAADCSSAANGRE